MSEDTKTLKLTIPNKEYIEKISSFNKFKDDIDIGRFAFAYALKSNLDSEIISFDEKTTGKWSTTADTNNEMYNIVKILHPEIEAPFQFVENAINVGLNKFRIKFPDGNLNLRLLIDE